MALGVGEAALMDGFQGTMPGWSVIRLRRDEGYYADSLRSYQVRIDGVPVGKIAQGETKDFPVSPGEHRLRLTLDRFWTSREAALQLREGERADFTCHAPWVIATLLSFVVPHRHIHLNGPV
jgi:hypothetical protein